MSRTSPPPAAPTAAQGAPAAVPPGQRPPSLGSSSGKLPRWAPGAAVGLAVLLAVALTATGTSPVLAAVVGAAVATLLLVGVSRAVEGSRRATDRLVTCLVTIAFAGALAPLVSLLWTVVDRGLRRLDGEFLTFSMLGVVGEGGGAYHAMMGTLIITLIATLISVPIGVMTAIYLVEYGGGKLARWITFLVDVMTGIPSIVAGLFAIAFFTLVLDEPGVRMGVIGSVALSVLMIPIVVRSVEEMLKIVPAELREASYALGVPKWLTIVKVVLPTAASGIASGITIAIARVIGETAPLLVTVGITTGLNLNPLDGRMATLPVYAYYQFTQPGVPAEAAIDRAWTAALLLIIIVMLLNVVARVVARALAPKGAR